MLGASGARAHHPRQIGRSERRWSGTPASGDLVEIGLDAPFAFGRRRLETNFCAPLRSAPDRGETGAERGTDATRSRCGPGRRYDANLARLIWRAACGGTATVAEPLQSIHDVEEYACPPPYLSIGAEVSSVMRAPLMGRANGAHRRRRFDE